MSIYLSKEPVESVISITEIVQDIKPKIRYGNGDCDKSTINSMRRVSTEAALFMKAKISR
jgi:hypothetical protein